MFVIGLAIFTAGLGCRCPLEQHREAHPGRAIQGAGAAMVVPLTLTILSAAVPAERRGLALGAWGAVAGLAIALGPVVGGAITEGLNWHWIFWINVPIGIVLVPLARVRLTESRGPSARLDLPGLALVSGGLLALVWGIIRGNPDGWTSPGVVASITVGLILLAGFVAWERYARRHRCCRCASSAAGRSRWPTCHHC